MGTNPYLLQSSIKGGFYEKTICLQLGACCDSFGMFFCAFYPFRGWNFNADHDHGRGKYCNRRWWGWDLSHTGTTDTHPNTCGGIIDDRAQVSSAGRIP